MRVLLLFCVLGISFITNAQISGKVISVADGDTFTMLSGEKKIKVRLFGIDAPELKQDFGTASKAYLTKLIDDKPVYVQKINKDKYGRVVGIVSINNINVNELLLKEGQVWHYDSYDQKKSWETLEQQAKKLRKGLWSKAGALEPWKWRKQHQRN